MNGPGGGENEVRVGGGGSAAAPARDEGSGRRDEGSGRRDEASGCPANTPHGEAWGALARTHAAIAQRLQEALAQGDFPPLPWYEVLATVAEAPERRMRMGDLAEALVITRGGLTKLVDRLVKAELLERTFCETDRRVSYATLLPAGERLLAEMRPVIVSELEDAFSASLSVERANELRRTLDGIRANACRGIA